MKKSLKNCSKLALIAFATCLANLSFALSLQLVNQSTQDMSVFYNICTTQSAKPQASDCDKGNNTLLLAGKATTINVADPQKGYTTNIVVTHTQNAESYGNYNFDLCSSNDSQPALFSVTDGKIFCVASAANLY